MMKRNVAGFLCCLERTKVACRERTDRNKSLVERFLPKQAQQVFDDVQVELVTAWNDLANDEHTDWLFFGRRQRPSQLRIAQ